MSRIVLVLIPIVLFSCSNNPKQQEYAPDWESLSKHEASPEWFRDAKMGIYFHWGVYSVPAFGNEWYPRWMHFEGRPEYVHHLENYGKPSEFGYHDFVPMFTAENFDAEEWADLFVKAGARFAGPVAEHHDGFSMWDSEVTPWNAADKGPGRDITGELKKAMTDRDLKFITTFHHAKNLQRFDSTNFDHRGLGFRDSHYPFFEGMPPQSMDKELRYLYGNIPEEQWLEEVWYGKLKEVVDLYQPDIMWFDSWLDRIPEEYRKKLCTYYLNKAEQWDKEVVIVRKQDDLPLDFTVDDLEKSRKNELGSEPWMTDETISMGSWCYTDNLEIKQAKDLLYVLIDIVSKNGVLLLNISPMADGTIPADQKEVLLDMGRWLERFGEAIYGTRPWYTFGEGPTKEPEGHFKNREAFLKIKYSWKDVRYTKKNNVIYATLLGWPSEDEVVLKAFADSSMPEQVRIRKIAMLGSEEQIEWTMNKEGLTLSVPAKAPDPYAVTYRIEL